MSLDDLFQPESPALFNDCTTRVSASTRRKRTEHAPVEVPSPMKKRIRRHSISIIDTSTFSLADDFYLADFESKAEEISQKRPIRPSDPALQEWVQHHRNEFLRVLLWHDGRGSEDADICTRCGLAGRAAVYRCDDCFNKRLLCKECCLETHGQLPLHVLQRWDRGQSFFSKTSLRDLGLRVQLGHPAADVRCPKPAAAHSEFVVLHDNGIHQVAFDYCGCNGAKPEYLQLLQSRFFPATTRRPQTCATFTCLDRFHAFSLKPKTAAFDFYDTLERLTNGAGGKPLDRYRMLLRMEREWRHLLLLKRGGRFGHKSNEAENTAPGELAILCPACPRPGVNLPDDWQNAEPKDHCLYTQFFAMDACFQLKRRMVSSEARDPALGSGFAFMVESTPYREYLRKATNKQEMSTCSGLKALEHANTKFSKGYAATGVGMVVCARHEFVQPTSVGDLQKGERYSNMDYIFASMLRHIHQMLRKVVSYDIVCQWYKKIFERIKGLPVFLKVVLLRRFVRFVVPKLHILAHIAACRNKFDLNLVPGSGQTDAEGIERAWASAGGLSGSTKMMGPGARSDMLDAYWSFWNWTKVLGLPTTLRQRLDTANVELARQIEAFELFSEEQEDLVPTWRKMVLEFEADGKKKNPYVAECSGKSEAEVRLELRQAEEREEAEGRATLRVLDVGPVGFMEYALAVERQQRRVRAQAALKKSKSTAQQINLGSSRRKLNRDQQHLRTLQATFTPDALTKLAALDLPETTLAEDVPLFLPSALAASWRSAAVEPTAIQSLLLRMERELRCAQMQAALSSLRNHLHLKYKYLLEKSLHIRHQAANTRARAALARNESQILLFADLYQIGWFAILQIEAGDESRVGFMRLRREDIRYMDDPETFSKKAEKAREREERQVKRRAQIRMEEGWSSSDSGMEVEGADDSEEADEFFTKGSNKTVMSWIWRGTKAGGNASEMLEAVRIEWCKSWARVRRWDEEVRMLREDTRRVPVTHEVWASVWEKRAAAVPVGEIATGEAEGMMAYALKQAAMHRGLAASARQTASEPRLARGRRRVRWVQAPAVLIGEGDGLEEPEQEDLEKSDDSELEELNERGDLDSDDDW
ncbi:CxC2 domain-containing protein [Mycena chlorophos]|uniref:CxC2 domain-containing protein n=1 Tax=Mycena chlorophos TaxID=658473 RepID=A0A8H6S5Z4_MYCCL|nr:CxC2 domain-containing protein [Mycena chlorophos]